MTKTLSLRSVDIPSIYKFAIGFDNMFDELMRSSAHHTTNFPPYNVIRTGDDTFMIELAVAGFNEGDITVSLDNRQLTVTGSKQGEQVLNYEYVHRGISSRDFKQSFTLAEHVEVLNATVKNGILAIYLERKIPLEKKPKTIDIRYDK